MIAARLRAARARTLVAAAMGAAVLVCHGHRPETAAAPAAPPRLALHLEVGHLLDVRAQLPLPDGY